MPYENYACGIFNDCINGSGRAAGLDLNTESIGQWLPKTLQDRFPTLSDKPTIEPFRQLPLDGSPPGDPLEFASPPARQTYLKVPVLRLGETADKKSTELLEANSPLARMYADHKNAIVEISQRVNGEDYSVGSGFFISEDGRIATAKHVIGDAEELTVTTADGRQFQAKPVSQRDTSDVAAIQLVKTDPDETFQALKLADTAQSLRHGDAAYTLGHPHGWDKVYISPGTIDDLEPSAEGAINLNRLSIKAFVHTEPGNSGGPLLNAKGEVIGLVRGGIETDNQTVLSWLNSEDKLSGVFNTVDDLKAILPEYSSPRTPLDYVLPGKLNFSPNTIQWGLLTGFSAMGAVDDWQGTRGPSVFAGIAMTALAGMNLYLRDVPYARGAFKNGSVAEKIDSSLNVAADAMIMSRAIGFISPRARAVTGALQLGGAAFKFADGLLARRAYD